MTLPAEGDSQWLYRLFDAAPVALLVTDVDGVILFGNASAAALFGCEQRQLVRQSLVDMMVEDGRDEFRDFMQRVGATNVSGWRIVLESVHGSTRALAAGARLISHAREGKILEWALRPAQ